MKAMKEYRVRAMLGPLFKLLEAVFELFVPLVIAEVIDCITAESIIPERSFIFSRFGILMLLTFVGYACSVTAQYFAALTATGVTSALRHRLFDHIQKLSFSDIDKESVPALITRLTGDLDQVQNGVNLALRLLLRSPFVVFGAMIMVLTIDVQSALIFLAVITVLFVIVSLIMWRSTKAYVSARKEVDTLTEITRENLTGARVIRAFVREENEIKQFSEHNEMSKKAQEHAGRIAALMNPLTFLILNLGIIILLYICGVKVDTGKLTIGQTVAVYNYMTQILVELIKFANLVVSISKAVTCADRVQKILEISPAMTFKNTEVSPVEGTHHLEFRSVTLTYSGAGAPSLSNISFYADRGETIGIIGGTGSGKTSLVNLIPRFYDATEGEILVDGVNVRDYPAKQLRDKIGYVMQKSVMFSGTIRENLSFGCNNADDSLILRAAETAQALNVIENKNGLDAYIDQGGRNLSGGQRQRLSIARAIAKGAEILILDDSSSALDYATDLAMRNAVADIVPHPTTLIVSQRTSSIKKADRIIVLDDGRLAGIGTHEELLKSCPVYREINDSQDGGTEE